MEYKFHWMSIYALRTDKLLFSLLKRKLFCLSKKGSSACERQDHINIEWFYGVRNGRRASQYHAQGQQSTEFFHF